MIFTMSASDIENTFSSNSESFISDIPTEIPLSGYTIVERISQSKTGYSEVYKVARSGRWFVAKCLKPEYRGNLVYEQLLKKEYETGYRLSDEHLCTTLDFINLPEIGNAVLMEYIEGKSLRWHIDNGKNDKRLVKKWIAQLCQALSYMHHHQTIHRDIKPENILITNKGKDVKVIDFGFSDTDDSSLFKEPAGTRHYAAPEVLTGQLFDHRADIYSFGITIKELIISSGIRDSKWKRIIRRCTSEDPNKRYPDSDQLLLDINSRWLSRHKVKISVLLIIIVLFILGLVIYNNSQQSGNTNPKHNKKSITTNDFNTNKIDIVSDKTMPSDNIINESDNPKNEKMDAQQLNAQKDNGNKVTTDNKGDNEKINTTFIYTTLPPEEKSTKLVNTDEAPVIIEQTTSTLPDYSDVKQLQEYYAKKKVRKESISGDAHLIAKGDQYTDIYKFTYDLCSNACSSGTFDKDEIWQQIIEYIDKTVDDKNPDKHNYEIYASGIFNKFYLQSQGKDTEN